MLFALWPEFLHMCFNDSRQPPWDGGKVTPGIFRVVSLIYQEREKQISNTKKREPLRTLSREKIEA